MRVEKKKFLIIVTIVFIIILSIAGGIYFVKYRTYKPFANLELSEVRGVAVLGLNDMQTVYLLEEEERADFVNLLKSITVRGTAKKANEIEPLMRRGPVEFWLILQDDTRMLIGEFDKYLFIDQKFYKCDESEWPLLYELAERHNDWVAKYER